MNAFRTNKVRHFVETHSVEWIVMKLYIYVSLYICQIYQPLVNIVERKKGTLFTFLRILHE